MDPYEVLGLPAGAPAHEVRRRYRELAMANHPDRFRAGSEEHAAAQRVMSQINVAFEILTKTSARILHESAEARRRGMAKRAAEAAGRTAAATPPGNVDFHARPGSTTPPRRPPPTADGEWAQQGSPPPEPDKPFDYRQGASAEFVGVRGTVRAPTTSDFPGPRRREPPPRPVEFFAAPTAPPSSRIPPTTPPGDERPESDDNGPRRWFRRGRAS